MVSVPLRGKGSVEHADGAGSLEYQYCGFRPLAGKGFC